MRVAIYARVSSEEQVEGYSLDAQLRAARSFSAEHGWTIVREYIEEGRSARTDDISKRPQFKLLLDEARARLFDVVLVHKLDRFSRNRRIAFEGFDRLAKWGVGFVSLSENMDFSTPWGGLALTMLVGLAQFYSDNLSQETKKGWRERRAQGLYCGLLPFGAAKAEDGTPIPDREQRSVGGSTLVNYDGLLLAFAEAAAGRTDRQIARLLNERGYRVSGNRGPHPFSKDTLRGLLTNRFYLGEIPDEKGGWMKAAHAPLVPVELWERVQQARASNRRARLGVTSGRTVGSLTGVSRCAGCGSRINVRDTIRGRQRVECYGRGQGNGCAEPSAYLDRLETQLMEYVGGIKIPSDYQRSLLRYHQTIERTSEDTGATSDTLQARLSRLKDLYAWGDISREAYLSERDQIQEQLSRLGGGSDHVKQLERLAAFLNDLGLAWSAASPEQKNRLARTLFTTVWIREGRALAVEPRPDIEPFFRLSYEPSEELSTLVGKGRARGDSNPNARSRPVLLARDPRRAECPGLQGSAARSANGASRRRPSCARR
jgi:DNA invertase Pin-like site-specific DNA recombinase